MGFAQSSFECADLAEKLALASCFFAVSWYRLESLLAGFDELASPQAYGLCGDTCSAGCCSQFDTAGDQFEDDVGLLVRGQGGSSWHEQSLECRSCT
jgi:hypothetical protein